jgi:hypothetical protein
LYQNHQGKFGSACCRYEVQAEKFFNRWLVRVKGEEVAIKTLAKLRNLPVDAPYVQEEAAAIVRQIEEERMLVSGKGIMAEFRELFGPNNRYRIFLGVMLFVFMQMAGSNAINVSGTPSPFSTPETQLPAVLQSSYLCFDWVEGR